MSSSTSRTDFCESRQNQSISTGVQAFRCSSGYASCRMRITLTYQSYFALMVQSADDVHLRAAVLDRLGPAGEDLLVAHDVALGIAQIGAKRAEHAAVHAHVRRIEVRVDVVVGGVAVLALANEVGQLAELGQRHVEPLEHEAILERQPFAGFDFVADRFQRWDSKFEAWRMTNARMTE